ncbi:class I SAM-dependent methyltransferase [Nakamurella lactea]|uniref:class I SAM-dependent methyltransferase n=1 Tax=Nakamurella lactea TaxID=459515 RepID=UPI0004221718|nr:SAM-dependent methyltransferase [Nakamurella lactea]
MTDLREPSRTALGAARHRATHQIVERGRTFADPLAHRIVGLSAPELLAEDRAHPERRRMRLFIAARSRFAEDALAAAVDGGVRQLVVLGAGLDTFGYRNPYPGLRVFEVDHPATQAWKRARLADAGIDVPGSVRHLPVDLERDELMPALLTGGVDPGAPLFVSWLGVVPYLTSEAIIGTLAAIGRLPGAHLVFDYANPADELTPRQRADRDRRAANVASVGEPWRTHFGTADLHQLLRANGFTVADDLGPTEIAVRYFGAPADTASRPGGHVVHVVAAGRVAAEDLR